MDRPLSAGVAIVAVVIAACGGAPPAPAEPTTAPPIAEREPPPPAVHTVALAASLPQATRSASGLAPDGTLVCRQTYIASPPEDDAHCVADGYGLTARVMHVIDPAGAQRDHLESPLEVRRIADCGNEETLLRRVPRALLAQLAPALAAAPAASEVDLREVQMASCPGADLALRFPDGVSIEARGAVLRLETDRDATIELARGDEVLRSWVLPAPFADEDPRPGLELEMLCSDAFLIVAGGVVAGEERATTHEDTLACAPTATPRAADWRSFERVRIDRRTGAVTELAIRPPTLVTSPPTPRRR